MIEATGLLINGQLHDIPGLMIFAPAELGGPSFNRIDPGDYAMRPTTWVRYIVLHTTGGKWPQPVIAGIGPAGHAREVIDMWSGQDHGDGKRVHSAAPLIVDFDGTVFCAQDLVRCAAYHAEGANPYAVGIEMCTLPGGGIYDATLKATARLVEALTCSGNSWSGLLPIPFQIPRLPYRNAPLERCEIVDHGVIGGGGQTRHQLSPADLVGVIGHRDNTSNRGFGDPGEDIFTYLAAAGAEPVDFDAREDQALGRTRQLNLNHRDAKAGNTFRPLVVDGIVGPASIAAMRRHGFARWRDVA